MTGRAFLRPWQQGRGSVQALRVGHHQVRQGFAIGGVAVAVRLVGVEQDRVAGGEQEALLVDPHFQYPLRHHQVLLDTGGLASGELPAKAGISLLVLFKGYLLGIVLAFVLTSLAVSTQLGRDLLGTLTAMFNPLPAIALLPLALLWFGLGQNSLIFVLVHSVLWALALNTYAGFLGVSETLRMAGATTACVACASSS